MNVLVVTKLFPNAAQPLLAPFNRQQIAALARLASVRVLATVPYFPSATRLGRGARATRRIPGYEIIDGVEVWHPRTIYIPKIGLPVAPALYIASLASRLREDLGWADVLLGCWAYPDGVACVGMGAFGRKPVVVKVHGTDVNDVAQRREVAPIVRRALPRAHRVVAVSRALAERVVDLGVARERVEIVPNGIDRGLFRPREARSARTLLGVPEAGPLVLFVGALLPTKGVHELLAAFESWAAQRPDARLAIVGDGPLRPACEALARKHAGRVWVPGSLPPQEVATWMAASSLVTLPSHNEGTPNVLLEALASGRPVVATEVGGIPDLINHRGLGMLVPKQNPVALKEAWLSVLEGGCLGEAELARAAPAGWTESAQHLHEVLRAALEERKRAGEALRRL